jgi:hypothetical protein
VLVPIVVASVVRGMVATVIVRALVSLLGFAVSGQQLLFEDAGTVVFVKEDDKGVVDSTEFWTIYCDFNILSDLTVL